MREMDHDGLLVCRLQGEIFEASTTACTSSSPIFIRRFMNSNVARRMDRDSFLGGSDSVVSVLSEVEAQYGSSTYGATVYGSDAMYWMGYLYRYWSSTRECSPASIYRMMPSRELVALFEPYHSLDPAQAIERIIESHGIEPSGDITERGVQALRKLRSGERFEYAAVRL